MDCSLDVFCLAWFPEGGHGPFFPLPPPPPPCARAPGRGLGCRAAVFLPVAGLFCARRAAGAPELIEGEQLGKLKKENETSWKGGW